MRVAYVCADPGVPVLGTKGCSVHVRAVVRALRRKGLSVRLFARRLGSGDPADLEGVPIERIPSLPRACTAKRERVALASNDEVEAMLGQHGPFELVIERYSLFSYAGMEYARRAGIPGILEVNAPLVDEQSRHRRLYDREAAEQSSKRAFTAASSLMAVSEEVASWLRSQGADADRTRVVPNGVDLDRFDAEAVGAAPHSGELRIGFVGSLKPWHGVATLVDAFARLRGRGRRARLVIIGDGPERACIEQHLLDRGLGDDANLVGAVSQTEVARQLASLDVAVAPYLATSGSYFSPLKVYEYMAARLPVVASRLGQLDGLIDDGHNGLLVAPGDAEGLAQALDRLADDPDLRWRLGTTARQQMEQTGSWDHVATRLLDMANITSGTADPA